VAVNTDEITTFLDPLILRAQACVGQALDGKWRLEVLRGIGGTAAVYAATRRNGSRAAVKLRHAELSINHDVRSRFLASGPRRPRGRRGRQGTATSSWTRTPGSRDGHPEQLS
jgi:hypothetical protein